MRRNAVQGLDAEQVAENSNDQNRPRQQSRNLGGAYTVRGPVIEAQERCSEKKNRRGDLGGWSIEPESRRADICGEHPQGQGARQRCTEFSTYS